MFCDRCGTQLVPGRNYCGGCGAPQVVAGPGIAPRTGMESHFRLLGILWIAYSVLHLIPGLFLAGMFRHMPFFRHGWGWGWGHGFPPVVLPIVGFIGGLLAITAILGLIAGWGLLERAPWARPLALVMAVLSLFSAPLGTALGAYTLWALLSNGGAEYRRISGGV